MAGQVYRQGGHSRTQLASDEMASPRLEVDKAEAAKAASEQKVRGVSLVVLDRLKHKNKKRLLSCKLLPNELYNFDNYTVLLTSK
jgi:hypothetical protein